ncbi:helix-turn-helix transcriptional regulator [Candidatus Alkanophaga liquidiphilum]
MEGEKMESKGIHGKTAFMAALFVASVFILGLKLLNPTPIQIVIEGQNTSITQLPGFFTLEDVIIIVVASIILGVSGTYLLFLDLVKRPAGELVLEERKRRWKEIAKTLKENERKIYQAIIEAGGIIEQSELPEKTGISKASVSRALDLLESKGLVERRKRGMGNVILLK